ncbi:Pyridine nucleotide-disulphide oxidoreductase [Sporobacter termitidis DSM 10068]|uniref:Pyridine nucleotide-disulphide oxidoreductase n=1 Tax=Sporobacter termitidis DSM 10068 TaxID=1123282 RepID=A0A1M5XFK4_9FIRM|nr:FAD-dependent oxidoreductase [Sporobacter termitidis]SHH98655.1 Pyridine nucleotide-disulphide oxidoreductase [Sporobacter termitidis DSM 10068]
MKYVIIGAGAAGISAAGKISELDKRAEVTVISADEAVYSRCMLHHVISGRRTAETISFVDKDFFDKRGITWLKGKRVTGADFQKRQLTLSDGTSVGYNRLLIAAGSKASVPPVKGVAGAGNVFTLRDLQDVERISAAAEKAKKAVVLGGGLVGLDAASALLEKGLDVSVVEMADRVLPLQLDSQAALGYEEAFKKAGAGIYTGVSVTEGVRDTAGAVSALKLSDGTVLPCDMVVAAAGVRPNVEFLEAGTIDFDREITVDDRMRTSVPYVYAAGDVTGLSAIWPSAVKQGVVAACNMTGNDKRYEDYFTAKNSISLLGLDTVSVGLPSAPDDSYTTEVYLKDGVYKKIIFKDGVVCGVILQKDIARSGFWTQVIKNKEKLELPDGNPFKVTYADFYNIDSRGSFRFGAAAL